MRTVAEDRKRRAGADKELTWVYNSASSGPAPLLFAVKRTQKTDHHLERGER